MQTKLHPLLPPILSNDSRAEPTVSLNILQTEPYAGNETLPCSGRLLDLLLELPLFPEVEEERLLQLLLGFREVRLQTSELVRDFGLLPRSPIRFAPNDLPPNAGTNSLFYNAISASRYNPMISKEYAMRKSIMRCGVSGNVSFLGPQENCISRCGSWPGRRLLRGLQCRLLLGELSACLVEIGG